MICTWASDGTQIAVGKLYMTDSGKLTGFLVGNELVDKIFENPNEDFILSFGDFIPEEDVIKSADEVWGDRKERAWNVASSLVGPLILEHGLNDRNRSSTIFTSGYVESEAEQHAALIESVADWLLGE
jgi:hypothetical protein